MSYRNTLHAGLYRAPESPEAALALERLSLVDGSRVLEAPRIAEGASKPLWGEDWSSNNGDHPLSWLLGRNNALGIIRITGGLGGAATKGVWFDSQFLEWERQIPDLDEAVWAYYGFPVDPNHVDIDTQLDVFINGAHLGWDGRIPMVDYEGYGPNPAATCTPAGLKAYVRGIWRLLGVCHIIIYAGFNFWNAPPFTGLLKEMFPVNYEYVHLMNAWYFTAAQVASPHDYYSVHLDRSEWWHPYGGVVPELVQYCIGAGNQDQDAIRVSKETLHSWAQRG